MVNQRAALAPTALYRLDLDKSNPERERGEFLEAVCALTRSEKFSVARRRVSYGALLQTHATRRRR